MAEAIFRKIIFLSFLLHFALFSLFSFSFKKPTANSTYTFFYYFGRVFNNVPQALKQTRYMPVTAKEFLKDESQLRRSLSLPSYYRPALATGLSSRKEETPPAPLNIAPYMPESKAPGIMFYPVLPYGFPLYFNDRQVAHVELKFRIEDMNNPDYMIIKRSISSGNLEVDLLTKRYIQRHLFIEHANAKSFSWQTVKIDLSSKND